MKKTVLYIPEDLYSWYKARSKETGCPVSEYIRRAMYRYQSGLKEEKNVCEDRCKQS